MVKTCRNYYKISSILARIILLIVFLLPLCFTLSRAFFTSEGFTLNLVKEAFTSSYNYKILAFTIEESVYSAIISILIALPGAILFSTYDFKGKKIILSLSSLCFVLPSILVVLGFVIFYGNNGILNKILFLMPYNAIYSNFSQMVSYKLGNIVIDLPMMTIITYIFMMVIALICAKKTYSKHQVA